MYKTEGKIGTKELFSIIILVVGTKLTDNTPLIFFDDLGNAAWMAIILIFLISLLPIYFLTKVMTLYPEMNLVEVTNHLFGKYIGTLLLFGLWLLITNSIISTSAVYTDIIGTMYFTKTPIVIIYLLLIAVAVYIAKKGLENIGSASWVTIISIKISLAIVLLLAYFKGETAFLFPLFGEGELRIMKESALNSSIFAEFLLIALIATNVKNKSSYKKAVWLGLLVVTVEIAVALIAYVMLFDYNGVKLLNYPFHETIRLIELGFITNVESMFFPFWLIATFLRFSFLLYINALLFGGIFKIKNFEYIIPTLGTIIVFLGLIPETPVFNFTSNQEIFLNITTPIFLLMPFLLWVSAKVKGDYKK
ncbi:GerAB/ArcD/ProY family transporter [Ureibacillus aquaedulcis]|uniref:Endospore germination permease n=1 Tax=Ureibacillus aquaedulcis TaxID=3058421 RepID=A0ABT8GWC6_9BACL|nr:endospore germination permease [Ureibacillus sp. BA0131]MDN4495554.1 endospore germination permease [Ureibacillus sp. BA0131]